MKTKKDVIKYLAYYDMPQDIIEERNGEYATLRYDGQKYLKVSGKSFNDETDEELWDKVYVLFFKYLAEIGIKNVIKEENYEDKG